LDQRDRSVAVRATFRVRPIGLLVGAVLLVGELALVMSLLLNGFLLPVGWWDRWLPPAINLGAGGLVLLRGVIGTGRRAPWVITGVGLLCSAMGDLYYSIALFGRYDMHSPTLADGLWLGAYLFYYAGLVLLVRAGTREFHPSMWLDGFVAGLGVAALGALAFGPLTDDAEPGWLLITLLAYPAADLLLVSLMVGVLAARGWQWSGPWIPLALGCTVNAVADIGVLVLAAEGSEAYGAVVDAMWSAAFLLLAVAAWRDRGVDRPVRLTGGRVLVVPVLVTLASLLVLLGDVVGPVPLAAQLLAAGAISGVLVRTALTFREVAALAETRRAARTDDLTGLSNRRDFYRRVTAATGAPDHPCAVLLIDLDRFKEVNDSLGHQVGDQLLVQVGRRLRDHVRPTDTVGRLGGDEFAVLLQGAGVVEACRVAVGVRDRLREPFGVGAATLRISGSVGIGGFPDHADDVHGLLRCADTAMYAAKAAGGVRVYDPAGSQIEGGGPQTAHELFSAIETAAGRAGPGPAGTLVMRYQPKLDLRSRRVSEFEVLVRWQHPRRGMVPPAMFLPLAERAGLMGPLTEVVLRAGLLWCRRWHRLGRDLTVAVNISATSLVDRRFAAQVAALLAEYRLPPSALTLEITESAIMTERERCFEVLQVVHDLGVRISIDDYGTGYSSLAYLQDLPVDELKLDRVFIARMDRDPRTAAIVASTIALAHSLGLPLVAEGVETSAALEVLAAAGCDFGQGYLIARPLAPEEVGEWLDRSRPGAMAIPGPAVRG
jgi:diguanylate cyclase (GGDEF)-like protein